MDLAVIVTLVFGLLSLIGGAIGYVKAESKASLIAGSISGVMLLGCAFGIAKGNPIASGVSLGIALLLGGRFLGGWFKKRRIMPDLLMVLLSLATLVVVGMKLIRG